MPNKSYEECKRFVAAGLLGLAFGSVLLLVHKFFAVPRLLADLSTIVGGGIVLFSNSCIIYGLLIFAGDQKKE